MENNNGIEITISHLHTQVNRISNSMEKLIEKYGEMNETLIRNTITVEEHQRRSTAIEGWAKETTEVLKTMMTSLQNVDFDLKRVDDEIKPIKYHVAQVNKIVNFINAIPVVVKVIFMSVTIMTSAYGVFIFIHTLLSKVK